jgi:hypothetical protein
MTAKELIAELQEAETREPGALEKPLLFLFNPKHVPQPADDEETLPVWGVGVGTNVTFLLETHPIGEDP